MYPLSISLLLKNSLMERIPTNIVRALRKVNADVPRRLKG